jgi:hypothetical protein
MRWKCFEKNIKKWEKIELFFILFKYVYKLVYELMHDLILVIIWVQINILWDFLDEIKLN